VQDGDLLAAVGIGQEVAGDDALLVVAAADAKHVVLAFLGQLRVGGGRRDLQHALLLVDLGGRDRGARAEVPGHEGDSLRHELVGDRHGLLRIAGVVADAEHQLFAQDAAGRVEVGHGHFRAAPHLLAEGGVLSGHRPGGRDLDFRLGGPRGHEAQGRSAENS
jgi:hypothetical protein